MCYYTLTIWVLFLFVVIQPSLLMLLLCCLHGYTGTLHCALSAQHLTVSTWAPSPGAWLSSGHELKSVWILIFTSCLALNLLCVLKLESELVAGLRMNLFCNCCLFGLGWNGSGDNSLNGVFLSDLSCTIFWPLIAYDSNAFWKWV